MFQFDLFNDPPTGNLSSPASHPRRRRPRSERGRARDGAAAEHREHPAAQHRDHQVDRGDRPGRHHRSRRPPAAAARTSRPLGGQPAERHHHPRRLCGRRSPRIPAPIRPRPPPPPRQAQVAIVFASYPESEGSDLTSISLPNNQNAMIDAVAAANPNTIVVLNTGGPVLMPWLSSVKGVVEAWYPGQDDGTAIASVLFGDIDPSGHLPETFPTSLSEIPTASPAQFPGVDGRVDYSEGLDVGYRWYDAKHVTPLFPFGYGLSYTSFSFSHLTVTPKSVDQPCVRAGCRRTARAPAGPRHAPASRTPAGPRQRRGAALRRRPGRRRRAPAPAGGVPSRDAAAAAVADRHLHDHRPRTLVLQPHGERMDPAQRPVLDLRRRLLRADLAAAAREAERHARRSATATCG